MSIMGEMSAILFLYRSENEIVLCTNKLRIQNISIFKLLLHTLRNRILWLRLSESNVLC